MSINVKLNLSVTFNNEYDKKKQIRALMPNIIHSLDAFSLSLLHKKVLLYKISNPQFYLFMIVLVPRVTKLRY